MARSQFLDLLDGYEDPRDKSGEPLPLGKRFFVRELSGVMRADVKRPSTARIYKFLNMLSRLITYTRAKVYGVAALTFGTLSFIFQLLGSYFGYFSEIPVATLIICGVFSAFGILLLFSDKPIPIMLQDNPVLDFIFFDFFCIQRVHRKTGEASIHVAVATAVGGSFALLSLFVSPVYFIAGLIVLLFVSIAFGSPEFSYITTILFLPYLNIIPYSGYLFIALIIITAVSFLRKVIYGKRVISFEKYDFLLMLMMLMVLISGIFIKGLDSFISSAILCVMSFGYFLTSSIITNRRLADCVMNSVVVSSIPPTLFSIISYTVKCIDAGKFLEPSETAFFGSTSVFATFLIVAVCFSFANIIQIHLWSKKLFYILMLVLSCGGLFLTGELFAILALVLGGISYFIFKMRHMAALIAAFLIFLLPYSVYLLPNDILIKIFDFVPSFEGYEYYVETLKHSFSELCGNFVFGIGIGSESFVSEMSGRGVEVTNSGNLFLELALEAGALSLLFFILLLVSRARHRIRYYSLYVKESTVKHSQPVVAATVCALVFYGTFSYIWADVSMFYLFFVVFAVESAMLRVSRKAIDDRVLYYEDARSSESSAVDIGLVGAVD